MSDLSLRELERRWRNTGSLADEAAFLRERLRTGDLAQEHLEIAAYCGRKPAMQVAGIALPMTPVSDCSDTIKWLENMPPVKHAVLVRAALEVARHGVKLGLANAKRERLRDKVTHAERAILATQEWLRCPCPRHKKVLGRFQDFGGPYPKRREPVDLAEALAKVVYVAETSSPKLLIAFVERCAGWWKVCRSSEFGEVGRILAETIAQEVLRSHSTAFQ